MDILFLYSATVFSTGKKGYYSQLPALLLGAETLPT